MNSKRLLAIASLIDKDDEIVDIGCDHAYLDIYLIKNKLCKSAIASDISKNALNQAITNIKKYCLTQKIKTVVSDGLKDIDLSDSNTIVISGMGTSTILDILNDTRIKSIKKIILQSNNNLSMLREEMNKRKFKINNEIVVSENNKYYTIIEYIPGTEKLSRITKLIGLFNNNNKEYYEYLIRKNKKILSSIPRHDVFKIAKLYFELCYLKKYLKDSD